MNRRRTGKFSRGSQRKGTQAVRQVPGIHSVNETIKIRPDAIEEIWLRTDWQRSHQLLNFGKFAKSRAIRIKELSLGKLDEVCRGHQGIVALVNQTPEFDWASLEGDGAERIVFLDGIEDPQNLGAMMRTAWLMGVKVIFVPKDRAAGLGPTVCKTASGATEHVPLEICSDFSSIMRKLKELDFWVYALAEGQSESLYRLNLHHRVAWVIGAEDKGVRKATLKEADVGVCIPQIESGSSYNASVAMAIALSESVRTLVSSSPKN